MKDNIHKLALKCKRISDERMGTDKNLIPYRNILFTDYTVKGAIDEYLAAIGELSDVLQYTYPAIGYDLR